MACRKISKILEEMLMNRVFRGRIIVCYLRVTKLKLSKNQLGAVKYLLLDFLSFLNKR